MPTMQDADDGGGPKIQATMAEFTHDLWVSLQDSGGFISVKRRIMADFLYDVNEQHNPKLGMSNAQWMFAVSGVRMQTKSEVFAQWCQLNHIDAKYNDDEGTLELRLLKGAEDAGSTDTQ